MSEGREYPRIITEREQSSVAACWREYLRLALNYDGSVTLAARRYELLARDEFTDERWEFSLPDEIAGKMV